MQWSPISYRSVRLHIEMLESRLAPAIRLDLVALHEFGHSLGLPHENTSAVSILDPTYNASYSITNTFLTGVDPAVQTLRANLASGAFPWNDSNGNGVIDITYSYMPDGVRMDGNKGLTNTLNQTMNASFGSVDWKAIFTDALNNWRIASNFQLEFILVSESGKNADGASGAFQNDPKFGDFRIGAHKMPGPTLAHAYYPDTRNGTSAGDAHFDSTEKWTGGGPVPITGGNTGGGGPGGALTDHGRDDLTSEETETSQPDAIDVGSVLRVALPRFVDAAAFPALPGVAQNNQTPSVPVVAPVAVSAPIRSATPTTEATPAQTFLLGTVEAATAATTPLATPAPLFAEVNPASPVSSWLGEFLGGAQSEPVSATTSNNFVITNALSPRTLAAFGIVLAAGFQTNTTTREVVIKPKRRPLPL